MSTYSFEINGHTVTFTQSKKDFSIDVDGDRLHEWNDQNGHHEEYTEEQALRAVQDDIEFYTGTGEYDEDGGKGGLEYQQEIAARLIK